MIENGERGGAGTPGVRWRARVGRRRRGEGGGGEGERATDMVELEEARQH